eukprot:TRINITY_DN7375_c0_g1_i1.p1 TRINITY_DN7375_c0_g1~~TRINITY_DN7375_c0_g1_i1.p1  ORF type:complete len:552 (+),score=95.01 TRINITY_DN7375_c0_g1_i1:90-1658(+)
MDVVKFKHILVRLASLLYCAALQQVAICEDEAFEVMSLEEFDFESLKYLATAPEKTLVIMQWIQQHIMSNHNSGVLSAPAPILSRVFQELSNGIIQVTEAQKITDVLFPFPYSQMISIMLCFQTIISPFLLATVIESTPWCAVLNFVSVFSLWAINKIAEEIEMPFGDDPNDLPIGVLQYSFNSSLAALLDPRFANCPAFELSEDTDRLDVYACPYFLITPQQNMFQETHFKESKRNSNSMKARRSLNSEGATGQPHVIGRVSKHSRRTARQASNSSLSSLSNEARGDSSLERPRESKVCRAARHSVIGSLASQEYESLGVDVAAGLRTSSDVQQSVDPASLPESKLQAYDSLGVDVGAGMGTSSDVQQSVDPASLPESKLQDAAEVAFEHLTQRNRQELAGQVAELSAKLQRHLSSASRDLGFITKSQASTVEADSRRLSLPAGEMEDSQNSLLVRVSEILERQMSLMVQELDEVARDCATSALRAQGSGRRKQLKERKWHPRNADSLASTYIGPADELTI